MDNMGLVKHIALRYRNIGSELEDLIQEGNIGLIAAVEKFNPELGFQFSAFAGSCIENHIRKYLRNQRKHRYCMISLDQETTEDGKNLGEIIGFRQEAFDDIWKRECLKQAIGVLSEKERKFIWRYYVQGVRQMELAREYGISQAQVSRMLKRILMKMREAVR